MIRGSLTICLCVALAAAAQQPAVPGFNSKITLRAAHTVFLTEIGKAQGHEDPSGQMFRATLESTKRFTVLPTTRGADLLLIYDSAYAEIEPSLQLTLRDGKTFADLATLEVPWVMFPTITQDEKAVRQLLDELFALSSSGPIPPFTVAPVPVNSAGEALGAELAPLKAIFTPSPINPDMARDLSPGSSVLVVSDAMPDDFPGGYENLAQTFLTNLGTSTGFRFVSSLTDADTVLLVQGSEGFDGQPKHWIAGSLYDAKTLIPITGVQVVAKSGNAKKGKPSLAEVSMEELANKFRKQVTKLEKDAAKK